MTLIHYDKVAAIIPAAGQGTRLGGQTQKQFRDLAGKPLLVHTLERVLAAPEVKLLVVAVPEGQVEMTRNLIAPIMPGNVQLIVTAGGTTRQKSVKAALSEVPPDMQVVTVHDAARPRLDPSWISETVALCTKYDGAIVAIPAVDTLKEVSFEPGQTSESQFVSGTLARKVIWQAQTPQTFRTSVLKRAIVNAEKQNISATDDASLVEAIGGKIAVVRGSDSNIKVTSLDDWQYLEWRFSND